MDSRLRKPLIYTITILIIAIVALIGIMIKNVFLERNIPQNPAEQAFAQANALVQKDPKNAEYLFERAKANGDLGRTKSAIEDLRRAIELRPSAPMLHYTLARIYTDTGNDRNAVLELQSELKVTENKNELAWFDLGRIYNRHRDFEQAIYCLNNALLRMKSGADAHFELGKAYQGIGKYNLAASEYEEVLKFIPDDVDAQSALKKIYPKTSFATGKSLETSGTVQKIPTVKQ
jgi:tetratricopeptide (TPR) repeat protein